MRFDNWLSIAVDSVYGIFCFRCSSRRIDLIVMTRKTKVLSLSAPDWCNTNKQFITIEGGFRNPFPAGTRVCLDWMCKGRFG